jgi:hypothetical protein
MDRYAGLFSYPFPEKQSQVRVYPEQKIREQCVVHGFYDGCCPGFTYAGFFPWSGQLYSVPEPAEKALVFRD